MEENKNLNPEAIAEENESAQEMDQDIAAAMQAGEALKPKKSLKKELREWVISIAVALLVVFVIRTFLFQIIKVDGDSMNSTLLNGERLFVTVTDVLLEGADRGDVVICHYPDRGNTNFVKRVVAVEGDQVYRLNGVTHVVYETADGTVDEALDERYGAYFPFGSTDDYAPYTLGEDEYFVVGDNRYNSHDSRDWNDTSPVNNVGPITEDMLVGKVRTVIWPLDAVRTVK